MEIFEKDFEEFWELSDNTIKSVDLQEIYKNTNSGDRILWGFSPVSPIHTGYDKIFFLLKSILENTNTKLIVLGADIPAKLSHGRDLALLRQVANYYKYYINRSWGIKSKFMLSSDYFYENDYQDLLFKILTLMTEGIVKDTWNTNQKDLKLVYQYIYPIIQALDVIYLKPKIIFSEYSQYKIYKILPKVLKALEIELNDTYFVFIKQSLDIRGRPLMRSTQKDRITIHENSISLRNKLRYCASFQTTENNPFLDLIEYSILPFKDKFNIPIDIIDRKDLRNKITKGDLLLPQALEMVSSWFDIKLKKIQQSFDKSKDSTLLNWINFDKIRSYD